MIERSYPSKILLFGEYSLLLGSTALSIPFFDCKGCLSLPSDPEGSWSKKIISSNRQLFSFYEYLTYRKGQFIPYIELEAFKRDLDLGLYFNSDIPAGYGLGSSGALVAAIYEKYAFHNGIGQNPGDDLGQLRTVLSWMESCFHSKSSGFDPLVSLLQKPLFLKPDGNIEFAALPDSFQKSGAGIFLIDTGKAGKTAPLVGYFLEKFKPKGLVTPEGESFAELVSNVADAFLHFPDGDFWEMLSVLSERQMDVFRPMIPVDFLSLWRKGIQDGNFFLKLCGSGGGGYLTGFAKDIHETTRFLSQMKIPYLSLAI